MSNNAADDYAFLKNFHYSMPSDKVVETTWMYQNDTQNGNYDSGKIEFDLSQFANNGTTNWQDWSRALLVIPLVITLNNNNSVGLSDRSDLAVALKRSYLHLINSVLLLVNNNSFTNNTQFQNIPAHFTQLVSASQDDLKNKSYYGLDEIDNSMSVDYNAVSPGLATLVRSYNGNGIVNNTCLTTALQAAWVTPNNNKGDLHNPAFLNRTRQFRNLKQYSTGVAAAQLQDEPSLKNEAKDYTYCRANDGVANADANAANTPEGRRTTYQVWYTNAIIKLSDLCGGYFDNLGLCKGSHYVKLTLDVNCQGSMLITRSATGGTAIDNTFTGSSTFNFTNPVQVNPIGIAAAGASNVCISIGIAKPPSSLISGYDGTSHATLGLANSVSNCRIYMPSVKLTLDAETALVSKGVSKKISFTDYSYSTTTISSKNTINMVVSNSIKNASGMLVVPMISKNIHGKVGGAGTSFAVTQSPFYPCAPCPLSLTNLNVNYASKNVFQQNVNYTWEMFVEQVSCLKSTNGGQTYGLSSCLLSKADWENMYRYYYINFPDNGSNASSISLTCYNNNTVDVDLMIFIFQNKTALVDIITGQVESTNF